MIEKMKFITRQYVQENPQKIFLFGDNLERKGYGGQAREMRGERNAIGIVTKTKPSNTVYSFLTDKQFELNKALIDLDIKLAQDLAKVIAEDKQIKLKDVVFVLPEDGIGTGLAQLEKKAPLTFEYLQKRLSELDNLE